MWKQESVKSVRKYVLNGEGLPDVGSAVLHIDTESEGSFDVHNPWDTYGAVLRPTPSILAVNTIHNGVSYSLGIYFYDKNQIENLARAAKEKYKERIDRNAEKWLEERIKFEEELLRICRARNISISSNDLQDDEAIDRIIGTVDNIYDDGYSLNKYRRCEFLAEKKELEIVGQIADLDRKVKEFAERGYVALRSVQRGSIERQLEILYNEPLTESEVNALRPVICSVVSSLPELESPFLSRQSYQDAVRKL